VKDPAVVETVDIGPTLADWFDVPMPTGLDGKIRSLSELPALD
jgi:arylsulfatase A-like enzyme